jgi:UPF0755 protein
MLRGRNLILIVTVALCLALGATAAVFVIAFAPNTATYEGARGVKIPREAAFEQVVDSLATGGILGSRFTFRLMARATGWGDQIKAGYYEISQGASNYDVLEKLRKGLQSHIRVTIPPGSRPEVVAAVLAKDMAFDADTFLTALSDTVLARSLSTDTTHLFGYMMPETYFFYWQRSPADVIRAIKKEFHRRYDRLAAAATAQMDLSVADVVTLASIVEWESGIPEERPRIAGVYLNRLRNRWRLQADPTIQYAILEAEGSKRRLFFRDYGIQHSYNTYLFGGLPPGPITNPSPSAIEAVLRPEEHRYFYFVATGDGGHIFSRTLAEHERNARNYRRLMRERRAQMGG